MHESVGGAVKEYIYGEGAQSLTVVDANQTLLAGETYFNGRYLGTQTPGAFVYAHADELGMRARTNSAGALSESDLSGPYAGAAPFAPRAKQARKVADNPSQAGRPALGKVKGAAPAGWGSRGASVAASTLAERKRVARRSRAGPRASQCGGSLGNVTPASQAKPRSAQGGGGL